MRMKIILCVIILFSLFISASNMIIMKARYYENQISEYERKLDSQRESIAKNLCALTEQIEKDDPNLANTILTSALLSKFDDVSTVLHANKDKLDQYEEDESLENFMTVYMFYEQYVISCTECKRSLESEYHRYVSNPFVAFIIGYKGDHDVFMDCGDK